MNRMLEYTPDQQKKIKEIINKGLDKSFEVNKFGKGTPMWMNLLFILDQFAKGNYYGTLEIKILGTSCNDVREKEKTHKLMEQYEKLVV